jgi:hypothetical protein
MNPNFSFVLVDLTTSVTPFSLRPAQAIDRMLLAFYEQIVHYGQAWGMPSVAFRQVQPGARQPNDVAINLRDTIPEAPGDLAYHQIVDGVPDIEIGVDLYSSLVGGEGAVSVGISHEVLETLADPGANEWASKKDSLGMMGAKEVCDPVENTWYYSSDNVALSNFVFPAYFMPGATGPFDRLGMLQAVTNAEIAKYGYEMQAAAPGSTSQVGGEHSIVVVGGKREDATWTKRKSHPYARLARREAHLR